MHNNNKILVITGLSALAASFSLQAKAETCYAITSAGATYFQQYTGIVVPSSLVNVGFSADYLINDPYVLTYTDLPASYDVTFDHALAQGLVTPSACGSASVTAVAPTAQPKQAIRSISTAIQNNILFQFTDFTGGGAKGGGSGDSVSERAFNAWVTPSYTSVNTALGQGAHNNNDMYQVSFGGDAKTGDLIYGLSGAYNRSDAGAQRSDDYRVAPYAAYSFSKNIYATAITGFSRRNTDTPRSNRGTDSNGVFTDASLSYIQPIGQAILVGKAGHRFSYSITESMPRGGNNNAWDNTWYVGGDALYKMGNYLPYASVVWEHLDPEESNKDKDSAFLKLGLQYSLQKDILLGASYQTELTGFAEDNKVNYHQAQLDFRVRF